MGYSVLVVEDEPNIVDSLSFLMKQAGHDVRIARDGDAALRTMEAKVPDLVLLDVMLPDIDGFAVIERLMAAGVDLPHVMISGLVDRDSDFGVRAFGGTPHVVKPIDRKTLMTQIEAALAAWRGNGQNSFREAAGWTEALRLPEHDRRRHRRFRTQKKATILQGRGIDCTVINLSHDGAGLRLPDGRIQCPESFELRLLSGPTHECRTRWRQGNRLGVCYSV